MSELLKARLKSSSLILLA